MSTLLEKLAAATSLKALSIWQPWADMIVKEDKDRENRTWEPPASIIGQVLAIHASKTYDEEAAAWIRREFNLSVTPKGSAVLGCIVGVAVASGFEKGSASRWAAAGQLQWVLEERTALPQPLPCRGAQGLWAVPPETFTAIRAQLLQPAAALPPAGLVDTGKRRLVQCVDCKGYMMGSGPGPHRHGPHRVGRVNCMGVVEP